MCPRGEIGRHKGLKILALLGVPVRVWPRAPKKLVNEQTKNIYWNAFVRRQYFTCNFNWNN